MLPEQGVFIALEGNDGTGKSTIAKMLQEKMEKEMGPTIITGECDQTTDIGVLVREKYLSGKCDAAKGVLPYLFTADRYQRFLQNNGIVGKLKQGVNVIADRYVLTSMVYSSYNLINLYTDKSASYDKFIIRAREVYSWNKPLLDIAKPNINIYFKVYPDTIIQRMKDRDKETEIIYENTNTIQKVDIGFDQILYGTHENWIKDLGPIHTVVNEGSIEETFNNVWNWALTAKLNAGGFKI